MQYLVLEKNSEGGFRRFRIQLAAPCLLDCYGIVQRQIEVLGNHPWLQGLLASVEKMLGKRAKRDRDTETLMECSSS